MRIECRVLCFAAFAPLAVCAQVYPSKPIRIIVPATSGIADGVMRAVGQFLTPVLGQPLVIENHPGANGIVGMQLCVKAPADGHTLCVTNNGTISFNPYTYADLPYEPLRDLTPITNLVFLDSAIVVHPSVAANSMRELIEQAKKPEGMAFSSLGVGSTGHMYLEWFNAVYGTHFLHVPYKGGDPALRAVIAGEALATTNALGRVLPQLRAGKVKVLAVTSKDRSAYLPDSPAFGELGLDMHLRTWLALFGPAGIPRGALQRLNTEVVKILAGPGVKEYLTRQTMEQAGSTPEQFAAFLKADREMAGRMVKLSGVKPEG